MTTTEVLTLPDAERLADRLLHWRGIPTDQNSVESEHWAADRERVASDLDGLRDHAECGSGVGGCDDGGHAYDPPPWGCADGQRYLANLRRTAGLYGVTA